MQMQMQMHMHMHMHLHMHMHMHICIMRMILAGLMQSTRHWSGPVQACSCYGHP